MAIAFNKRGQQLAITVFTCPLTQYGCMNPPTGESLLHYPCYNWSVIRAYSSPVHLHIKNADLNCWVCFDRTIVSSKELAWWFSPWAASKAITFFLYSVQYSRYITAWNIAFVCIITGYPSLMVRNADKLLMSTFPPMHCQLCDLCESACISNPSTSSLCASSCLSHHWGR